ncbi:MULTISPECIES: alanine racemase [Tritonibacter]|uniref:Alanine racemase n=1 Tax=Tritonibacter scottomollicae TaxID=483013 RepID=A0A2T1AIS4_TRISK|nr:alanine racemase [Tritonibacter scottomollicae]PRZ48496.1 alanine racemase [Tritonibacter scottomollicae]WOI33699.1 alanine racemase [Tritonibacter scottomollicae]
MSTARLKINLDALAINWRNLDAKTGCETAAVVKANGYGLEAGRVGKALAQAGARNFFVAIAEEGIALRRAIGPGPGISVFSGHMEGDAKLLRDFQLTPMLNSLDQMLRHFEALPGHPFGVQLDSGMNRLGMEAAEWMAVRDIALDQNPVLLMSHLACSDEPGHGMNPYQLKNFIEMTEGLNLPRSLAATGGLLLGRDYHFDLCRPGIGLYGGAPYSDALPVVELEVPVIQTRDLAPGESVGYGNTWIAQRDTRIATLAAGYADGLHRAFQRQGIMAYAGSTPCPVVGRISMDLITVDVTELNEVPPYLSLMNEAQTVDVLANAADTIGYEVLTSLGNRYARTYSA